MSKQTDVCCAPWPGSRSARTTRPRWRRSSRRSPTPVEAPPALLIAARDEDTCVCDLLPDFDVSQPTISHHLKILREAGLIGSERRGTWVYSWVVPQALDRLSALFATAPVR